MWEDKDVPILEPLAATKHYLKRQMLFMAVRGQSVASSDELGQGVLSLWEACRRDGQPIDFEVPLRDKGKAAGTLCGRLIVKWEDRRAERHARLLDVSLNLRQSQQAPGAATAKPLDSLLLASAAAAAAASASSTIEELVAHSSSADGTAQPQPQP